MVEDFVMLRSKSDIKKQLKIARDEYSSRRIRVLLDDYGMLWSGFGGVHSDLWYENYDMICPDVSEAEYSKDDFPSGRCGYIFDCPDGGLLLAIRASDGCYGGVDIDEALSIELAQKYSVSALDPNHANIKWSTPSGMDGTGCHELFSMF